MRPSCFMCNLMKKIYCSLPCLISLPLITIHTGAIYIIFISGFKCNMLCQSRPKACEYQLENPVCNMSYISNIHYMTKMNIMK